jgi:hypothetical protein
MRRLLYALFAILLFTIAACTTTDTPQPTIIVITATPEAPTPTMEVLPTNTVVPPPSTPFNEIVVNSNPYFGGADVNYRLPSSDTTRYQVVAQGWQPTARYDDLSAITVPPFINRTMLDNGNSILTFEFAFIQGEWGLRSTQSFTGGACYLLKQTGYLDARDGDMSNLSLGARLVYASESSLELRLQNFPARRGAYEVFWILAPQTSQTLDYEVYNRAQWAEWGAESRNDVEAIEVILVAPSWCDAPSAFDF